MRYVICEVTPEWVEEQQREFKRVSRVLQVFDSEDEALAVEGVFEPSRYGDYNTIIRVVAEDKLDELFR